MKNMLEKKLAELNGKQGEPIGKQAEGLSGEQVVIRETAAIEVAKRRSGKDMVLWLYAIVALILATLVNQYLPAYWQPANNIWTRIAVIAALIISAFLALAMTNQGSAFKTLLLDARVELRRVTWPSKQETMQYTWQVAVVSAILGLIVWVLDLSFSGIVKAIIG